MRKKIFLFGTGKIAQNYTKILGELSFEIDGYVDNDSNKWGSFFYGRKICDPSMLIKEIEVEIVIACADIVAITNQLIKMGVKDKIVTIDYLIRKGIEAVEVKNSYVSCFNDNSHRKKNIIVDNLNGIWGGAEDWAHEITLSLLEREYKVIIIENTDFQKERKIELFTKQINKKNKRIDDVYKELVEWLLQKKPFTLFNIWSAEVLWAASYIKKIYPKEVQIISSILNDHSSVYKRQCVWDDYIDLYLCISSRIKNNLLNIYGIDKNKIFYRVPYVKNIRKTKRVYEIDNKIPLNIGYPCRLVSNQKRADLLPKLIKKLEDKHVKYILNIAGDGPCEKEIMNYVSHNNLVDKVNFYGKLSGNELINFLDKQDIYLNFSEFEGTSLTMLEAMASGCVPVVTNVSGVDDFIENMKNGLISNVGDMEDITNNIMYLDINRDKLEEYSKRCVEIISCKCNLNNYINYIEKLIN